MLRFHKGDPKARPMQIHAVLDVVCLQHGKSISVGHTFYHFLDWQYSGTTQANHFWT